MKLDPRINNGKKPLTCFDTEEAKQFRGEQGYFSDSVTDFTNLDNISKAILCMVNDNDWNYPFIAPSPVGRARYFLPEKWTFNLSAGWRPYLIDEWLQEHNFGDVIEFRRKDKQMEFTMMFAGYSQSDCVGDYGTMRIVLGDIAYEFDYLFENYELLDKTSDGKFVWRPFGIEVK